jgi:hypothetical protein
MISTADELMYGTPGATPGKGAPAATPTPSNPSDALMYGPEGGAKEGSPEGFVQSITDLATKPEAREALKMAAFSPMSGKALPRAPQGLTGLSAVYGGTWNAIAPYIDSMHSLGGLATGLTGGGGMGLLSLANATPAATAALMGMKGAWTAMLAPQAIEKAKALKQVMDDPKSTLEQKVEAHVGAWAANVSTILPWLHQVESTSPEVLKNLKDVNIQDAPKVLSDAAQEAENPQQKAVLMHTAEALHDVAPVDIGPRDASVSTGDGVETPKETAMMPAWRDQIKTEQAPKPEEAPPEKLIGIKNVARDEAAEARGEEKPEHGEATTDESEQAKAQAKLEADPLAGAKLIDKLSEKIGSGNPVTVSTEDVFLASHEMVRAENERTSAENDYLEASKSGDLAGKQDAEQRIARARDNYTKVSNVVTQFGTAQAQAFRARAVMFKEDYSIASMEHQLAAGSKDGKLTPEQETQVRDISRRLKETQADLAKHEADRLKAFKARTAKSTQEMQDKMDLAEDLNDPKYLTRKKPGPEPIEYDAEAEHLKAEHQRVKDEFQTALIKQRLEQRSDLEKLEDVAVKWRRGFVLSGPVTLAKLTAAAMWRGATTPLEEATGALIGKLPVVREIAKGAPVEGDFNSRALGKAYSEGWSKGLRDAGQTLKTGRSDLDVLFGKGKDDAIGESNVVDRSIVDYIQNVHGALKAPIKRFSYTLAMEKQMAWGVRNGIDVGNPLVQTEFSNRAYRKAQANIFLQDNVFNDAWKNAMGSMERSKVSPGVGKAAATAARIAVPITKVPTNMVGEGIEYTTGLATGSWKIAAAARAGFETLTEDQKDVIMRNLKKGALGAGGLAALLGYFTAKDSPVKFGGFYQPGEKRKKGDVPAGSVRVFGEDVPSFLLDHPVFQAFQVGATTWRVKDSKIRKGDKDAAGWDTGLGAAALGLIDETPFGREDVEAGQIIGGDPSERQYRWGEFVKGLVVPQGVQTLANATDKDKKGKTIPRKETTVGQHVESGIPGLRETLPKRKIDHSER